MQSPSDLDIIRAKQLEIQEKLLKAQKIHKELQEAQQK